ncbi:MAG: non-reducing end alpha-L-arabinofuranosidase family hydrolase [Pirellulaceae bacterium]
MNLRIVCCLVCVASLLDNATSAQDSPWESGVFHWKVSPPILAVSQEHLPESEQPWIAVKDPSVVRYEDKWHLFCTLRKQKTGAGRIRIGYCSFADWSEAAESDWQVLDLTMGYHGAPQIFYFEPQEKWFLIYQAEDESRGLKYGPCYSTTQTIEDASSWTKPEPLYVVPEGENAGLDFWAICDETHAHLLFTSLNGRMWHSQTALNQFPGQGWTRPKVVLEADIFEASHTYKLKGTDQYLTLVEAQHGKRRYFKLFTAANLAGPWEPLAATREKPAVSVLNVVNQDESWATSYSHGEFLRVGHNQKLEIEPRSARLLFQGASDPEYQKGGYGDITWRLGLLDLVETP